MSGSTVKVQFTRTYGDDTGLHQKDSILDVSQDLADYFYANKIAKPYVPPPVKPKETGPGEVPNAIPLGATGGDSKSSSSTEGSKEPSPAGSSSTEGSGDAAGNETKTINNDD